MSLQSGLEAFNQGRYEEAIYLLEQVSETSLELTSPDYLTSQMWLMKAYQAIGETDNAKIIWQKLLNSDSPEVRQCS
jgi:tetratricopeptide (TPR) repeat protein